MRLRIAFVLAGIAAVAACGQAPAPAASGDASHARLAATTACSAPAVDSVAWVDDSRFTDGQIAGPQYPPISQFRPVAVADAHSAAVERGARLPGTAADAVRAAVVGPDGTATVYFSPQALAADDTVADVIDGGGMVVIQQSATGDAAAQAVANVGDRATLVRFGAASVALVHGDPVVAGGPRPYSAYWSAGDTAWSVESGGSLADLLGTVSAAICGQ